ncbi:polysaccharide pyruvyl transferase family protein [Neobacillus mesonae]|nr:polysaccharide pyruvyl transferase family protein [Neobacillus mesonae]
MNIQPEIGSMDHIKAKLKQIAKLIPKDAPVYYIDYPVHSNGGDLLIMKGTEAFFKNYKVNVIKRYSALDYPTSKINVPEGAVFLLHGGGNFGDLYPLHQKLRENIIKDNKNHRIIVMPQTLFFSSQDELRKTGDIINGHNDLHLFVRDQNSYDIAVSNFPKCHVYLSPDMAHELWPIQATHQPTKENLNFLRVDVEKTKEQIEFEKQSTGDYKDWNTIFTPFERKIVKLMAKLLKLKLPVVSIWYKYSDYLVSKSIKEFSDYKIITTSRLHGHILSCLMDKDNELLDNSYGKNSSYYNQWTHRLDKCKLFTSPVKTDHEISQDKMDNLSKKVREVTT